MSELLFLVPTIVIAVIGWLTKTAFSDRDRRITALETRVDTLRGEMGITQVTLARVEANSVSLLRETEKLGGKIDRLLEPK